MTDSPDKKNGDVKSEDKKPEASPSARGRGGRGIKFLYFTLLLLFLELIHSLF